MRMVNSNEGAMTRPTAIALYSVFFGVALLAGLLIATALLPKSLPAASFVAPTATWKPAKPPAATATSRAIAAQPTQIVARLANAAQPSAMSTSTPASTATSTPALPEAPTPTATAAPTSALTATLTPTLTEASTPAPTEPPPTLAFSVRVFDKPTDAAVACGTAFESRIWGVVKDRGGRGIARAVVLISSADGKHRYSKATNSRGGFDIPGLGCTTWIVRLSSVPRAALAPVAIRVSLNGGRYSGAGVEFRQR